MGLHSVKFPDKVMFEGSNKNLMLHKYKPKSRNEKFSFDQKKNVWYNEYTSRVMSTDHKNPLAAGSNVATQDYHPDDIFHQWELVSCDTEEPHTLQKDVAKDELDADKESHEQDGKDEDPEKVDEVEDQAKEIEKQKEKEDGETAPPTSGDSKSKENQEDTTKSENGKKEDEA